MTIEQQIAEHLKGRRVDEVIAEISVAEWRDCYLVIDAECRITGQVVDAADNSRPWRLRVGRDGWTQLIDADVARSAGWVVGDVTARTDP